MPTSTAADEDAPAAAAAAVSDAVAFATALTAAAVLPSMVTVAAITDAVPSRFDANVDSASSVNAEPAAVDSAARANSVNAAAKLEGNDAPAVALQPPAFMVVAITTPTTGMDVHANMTDDEPADAPVLATVQAAAAATATTASSAAAHMDVEANTHAPVNTPEDAPTNDGATAANPLATLLFETAAAAEAAATALTAEQRQRANANRVAAQRRRTEVTLVPCYRYVFFLATTFIAPCPSPGEPIGRS